MTENSNNICFHPYDWRNSCGCPPADLHFTYGRVRSGRRWFWSVSGWERRRPGDPVDERERYEGHGWVDTEAEAFAAAKQSIVRMAAGRQASAGIHHGGVADKLKELNRAKRAARPTPHTSDARPTEYLFAARYIDLEWGESAYWVTRAFPIVRKTAKRIYYKRRYLDWLPEINAPDISESRVLDLTFDDHDIGFVDRQKLEAEGEVYNHGRHWSANDFHLYAKPPAIREAEPDPPDLAALKAAMAAAHPDRGGSNATFIEARHRYVEARERLQGTKRP